MRMFPDIIIYSLVVAALYKMASVKKAVKSKGAAKTWVWWYRLMAKILITTIQVNLYCLIPASLGISTQFSWIVSITIFAINLYHHSHFLAATFDFTTFSHFPFWTGVRDQARYNRPRQPYTCLPGNFGVYIIYDLDDAICQLDGSRIFL